MTSKRKTLKESRTGKYVTASSCPPCSSLSSSFSSSASQRPTTIDRTTTSTPSYTLKDYTASIPSLPFFSVIEADHATLTNLVLALQSQSITFPLSRSTSRHLHQILWRLIRHDTSEELVMRPAFIQYMGEPGHGEAEEDRRTHARIKTDLLELIQEFEVEEGHDGGKNARALRSRLGKLSREMAEHMKVESGEVVPRFEAVVGKEVSLELGREYLKTLVLTPDVEARVDGEWRSGRQRWFQDVVEYARADVSVFRRMLQRLDEDARKGADGGYMLETMEEEMRGIGLCIEMRSDVTSQHDLEGGSEGVESRNASIKIKEKL